MKPSLALLAAALPAARSRKTLPQDVDLSGVQIAAGTTAGGRLLSRARRLDGGGDGDEMTWIVDYSLKFHSCTSSQDYYGGNRNSGNDGNSYQYNNGNQYDANGGDYYSYYQSNQQKENYQGMYEQQLVHFRLCPTASACWRCKDGADYVVGLGDFVDAALEARMTAAEYNCEYVRENCYCDSAASVSDCLYNCYKNAGMVECATTATYDQEFDVQEALECVQLEVEDADLVKSYIYKHTDKNDLATAYYAEQGYQNDDTDDVGEIEGNIYVGPYCAKNGKKIHLGLFLEQTCSYPAPGGLYEALHYGESLPYAKKSMVDSDCIPCKEQQEVDYENYWDGEEEAAVTEACAGLYANAAKCERDLDGYFPDRDLTGCEFLAELQSTGQLRTANTDVTAKVFAGVFAVTTALLAAAATRLFQKNRRQKERLIMPAMA